MDDEEVLRPQAEEPGESAEALDEVLEGEVVEQEDEESLPGGGTSWTTAALIGLAMLLVGALLGYFGRGQFGPEAQAARATEQAQAVMVATQAAANAELMKYLAQNTRHFKGDPNAPVTIIEFSDFQ
jgi:hypothetical protein